MIAEFGHYALVLALGLALVQASVPLYGARTNDPVLMAVAGPTALAQFGFVASVFGALVALFGANLPARLKANVLAVQSWIASTFYLFILLTSNPFLRLSPA